MVWDNLLTANWPKLFGLIIFGSILVYLRWSSPQQVALRKEKELKNLEDSLEQYKRRRNAILAQKRTEALSHDLVLTVRAIVKLRNKIRRLKGQ